LAADIESIRMMVAPTHTRASAIAPQRTRIITGLVTLIIAAGLALLGAWPSAIGLALGVIVGAGVIGAKFTPSDFPGERTRQARRFMARTRRVAVRIVVVGLALIIVGLWFWPVEVLGVFWLVQWATALPVAISASKAAQ
jgi:hypothetical protein